MSLIKTEHENKVLFLLSQETKPVDPKDYVVFDDILLIGEVGANHQNNLKLLACLCF